MSSDFQKMIHYQFKDPTLLDQALTHSSYAHETGRGREACNERLEFLGDAVLEFCSSVRLYEERPFDEEGSLSKIRASLVCEPALAEKAEELGLGAFLKLGKGEEKTGGRKKPSLTSDAMEALVGAIYLDGGLEAAGIFIDRFILQDLQVSSFEDYKTRLQEYLQADGKSAASYRLISEEGPDHKKLFTMAVVIDGQEWERGAGASKKAAEQEAAKAALMKLEG